MTRHATRDDLILALAEDENAGIIGFCYGYRGEPGQWWHDVVARALGTAVARALGTAVAREWLGSCREIAELHVHPQAQGRGLGRTLLRAVLGACSERTAALSVLSAPASVARTLYDSEGFEPLLENFKFPGTPTTYAVLGARLPLPSALGDTVERAST